MVCDLLSFLAIRRDSNIHSFPRSSQRACFMPGPVLGTRGSAMRKADTRSLLLKEFTFYRKSKISTSKNYIRKIISDEEKTNENKYRVSGGLL